MDTNEKEFAAFIDRLRIFYGCLNFFIMRRCSLSRGLCLLRTRHSLSIRTALGLAYALLAVGMYTRPLTVHPIPYDLLGEMK